MKRKLSKKQLGAMGLAAMMAVQAPVAAAEMTASPEATVQETTEIEEQQIETQLTETEISSEQAGEEYVLQEDLEVLTDGWNQDSDGKFTYVKDGQTVKNKVIEIDGKYYGFDDRGIMHANEVFYIRDSENDTYLWYRAKEDGSLYVNEWVLKWEPVAFYYYYGEEGKAASGLQEVDGTLYYFETGRRYQNTSVTVDGKNYYCKSDGVVVELQNDNWVDIDGKHMYVRDGQVVKETVIEIDGKYYGFDDSGDMYTNKSFSIWDSESGTALYYRAREDGSLYVKEWYRDSSKYYYYGEEGKAASGLQEVDGTLYCFNDEGRRYQNTSVTVDGKNYYCKSDGTVIDLQNDGWVDIDGDRKYIKDNQIVSDKVIEIAGKYYGFDDDGIMYIDRSFSIYNLESGKYLWYRAKEDGSLYVNEWDVFSEYYYGEEGKAVSGLKVIDGTRYYFSDNGRKYQNTSVTVDGKNYYCKSDGAVVELDFQNDEWIDIDGNCMYVKDGQIVENKVIEIAGKYYGFDDSGIMYANENFCIYDSENDTYMRYRAKEDGSLYVNEWYVEYSFSKYYYGDEGKAAFGLTQVDGILYYFSEEGKQYQNQNITVDGKNYYCKSDGTVIDLQNDGWADIDGDRMYIKDGQIVKNAVIEIDGKYYGFDYNGILYTSTSFDILNYECTRRIYYRAKEDGSLYVKEWYVDEQDSYYYYGEEGEAACGLQEVDGTLYYFNIFGERYQNESVTIDGKNYYCKAYGAVVELELQNDGWFDVDGKRMYVKDGQIVRGEIIEIAGKYYGFGYNGIMYINTKFNTINTEIHVYYRAKEDGSLCVNEWYVDSSGSYYYYGEEGKAVSGLRQLDGILYYFSEEGKRYQDQNVTVGGKNYYCNHDGAVVDLQDDGWADIDGDRMYIKDGQIVKKAVIEIDGKYYGFNDDGIMYTDRSFVIWGSTSHAYYRARKDGSLYVNEWYFEGRSDYTTAYYYGSDGKGYSGLQEIDGKKYCFFDNGSLLVDTIFTNTDKTIYYCDSDGNTAELNNNDWTKVGEKTFYVKDGKALQSCVAEINGAYYGFNNIGIMFSNTDFELIWSQTPGSYRAKEDGSLYVLQWYQDAAGNWFYYDETGILKTGWECLNGVWYYFDTDGIMATGWTIVDGVGYFFNESGAMVTGWLNLNGNWYYMKPSGSMAVGWCLVGNSWYYMSESGAMVTGWLNLNGNWYYMRPSGLMAVGWCLVGNSWYYMSESGVMVTGWLNLNGTWYYMGNDGAMLTGTQVIGGTTYIFNQDGAWVTN